MAKPYLNVENKLILTDPSIYEIHPADAAGAIVSRAEDMAKWMKFLLRNGVTSDNVTLVNFKTLAEVFKSHESIPTGQSMSKPKYPMVDLQYGYGYAWVISTYNGYKKSMHTGSLFSYITWLELYPDLEFGIFVSANGAETMDEGTAEDLISFYVSDILIGDQPLLNSSTACTFPLPWHKAPSSRQNNSDVTNAEVECLDCYVGKYGHYLFGDLDVKPGSGSSFELLFNSLQGSLNTTADKSIFKVDAWGSLMWFSRPGNATVLVPVNFHGLNKGKYSQIDLISSHKLTFTRGISFYEKNKHTSTKTEIQ